MEVLIESVIVITVIIFLVKKRRQLQIVGHHIPVIEKKAIVGYRKRYRIMNYSESILFSELRRQLPKDYYVFPNMRIADVIDAIDGRGFYQRRNKILPKHIDFVICNPDFKPLVAVELNGSSHSRLDRIEKDEEKRQIFEAAQLPLIVIKVGQNFSKAVERIKSDLKL